MQHVSEQCKVLSFADLGDERGKLVVVEGSQDIPFKIERVFYIYKFLECNYAPVVQIYSRRS